MGWVGHLETLSDKKGAYRVLVGKPEEKRPLGKPRIRWEDVIKMDLYDVEWEGMDWINLARGRERWRSLVNAVMTFWIP